MRKYSRVSEMFADLEVHIKRRRDLDDLLGRLSNAGDIYGLAGRGTNWTDSFEFTFEEFCLAVEKSRCWEIAERDEIYLRLFDKEVDRSLIFLKAQELLVCEGIDVVIIGARSNLPDFIPLAQVRSVARNEGGFIFIGHPFSRPNSLGSFKESELVGFESQLRAFSGYVDCIQTHNQQLCLLGSKCNLRAERFSREIGMAGLACSDSHIYRKQVTAIRNSGISFDIGLFRGSGGQGALAALKRIIATRQYKNHRLNGPSSFWDLLSLKPAELIYLYRFGLTKRFSW